MKDLQDEMGITYLFIAHDLAMVKYISDCIGVMHLGYIVETGTTDKIFSNPIHPYTRSLLSAIPHPNPIVEKKRVALSYDKDKKNSPSGPKNITTHNLPLHILLDGTCRMSPAGSFHVILSIFPSVQV